jgi:hypothetical protein
MKMSMNGNVAIKENLNRYFNAINIAKDDKNCHLGIYDYTKYIITSGLFDNILNNFQEDKHKNRVKFDTIGTQFQSELTLAEENILQIIKSIKNPPSELLSQLNLLNNLNKLELLEYRYDILTKVLERLHSNGFKKKIIKYFKVGDCGFSDYGFSKIYTDYIDAEESFRDNELASIWRCWDNLMSIYSTIALIENPDCQNMQNECYPRIAANTTAAIYGDEDKFEYEKSHIEIAVIKQWVSRVHNHIMSGLPIININTESLPKKSTTEAPSTNTAGQIITIEIKKTDRYYAVLINGSTAHKPKIKCSSEKNRIRYWDYIDTIARNHRAEVSDPKSVTGVLQFFNSQEKNPIYSNLGFQPTPILSYSSDFLYPSGNVKIMLMKTASFKEFFK